MIRQQENRTKRDEIVTRPKMEPRHIKWKKGYVSNLGELSQFRMLEGYVSERGDPMETKK